MDVTGVQDGQAARNRLRRALPDQVEEFAAAALIAGGIDSEVARSVALALTEASLRGVDSHGIRLLLHYAKVASTGRINPKPRLSFHQTGPCTGTVDADHGFGHHASFSAVDQATALAEKSGLGAVSVINSSHFGAAGCYVLRAARLGYIAIGTCNSDPFVAPHNGIRPFHGTNPLAFAAPVPGARPFLVDMASSMIPWNRMQDLMNEGLPLPPGVAIDRSGEATRDPSQSIALLPLGGIFYGYKGAALAGMAEVLSAILTGMPYCRQILGMAGPDLSTPRRLGHFFLAIDPVRFVPADAYDRAMQSYLHDLRTQDARPSTRVMAPGDREWACEDERRKLGIPMRAQLRIDLDQLAERLGIDRLPYVSHPD